MDKLLGFLSLLAIGSVAVAGPKVTNVTMTQDQVTGKVTISYHLDKPAVITVDVLTNAATGAGASVGPENLLDLKGDAFRLVDAGDCTITWKPRKSAIGEAGFVSDGASVKAEVKAWSTNCPPDYLVVDLTDQSGDRRASARFYPSAGYLAGGLTNNPAYRESLLVLRKIPAAGVEWRMGSNSVEPNHSSADFNRLVTLSRDYYIGVFAMTRQQCYIAFGRTVDATDSYNTLDECKWAPPSNLNWKNARGESDGQTTPDAPSSGSYLGVMRTRTGIAFDLPTNAQWEYACRAGTVGATYNADYLDYNYRPNDSAYRAATIAALNEIAWTIHNGTNFVKGVAKVASHPVGRLRPNAWGLYDMLGNVHEMILDYYGVADDLDAYFERKGHAEPIIDPCVTRATSRGGSNRIRRGGGVSETAWLNVRSAASALNMKETDSWCGMRVVCPVGL